MKEGFILSSDYSKQKGFFNTNQHRVLGDKGIIFFRSKIHEAMLENVKVITDHKEEAEKCNHGGGDVLEDGLTNERK